MYIFRVTKPYTSKEFIFIKEDVLDAKEFYITYLIILSILIFTPVPTSGQGHFLKNKEIYYKIYILL